MAKQAKSTSSRSTSKSRSQTRHTIESFWSFPFGIENFRYFALAFGVMVLGYILMATANTSDPAQYLDKWANPLAVRIAPTLLVIAYCVLFPLALMKRPKPSTIKPTEESAS